MSTLPKGTLGETEDNLMDAVGKSPSVAEFVRVLDRLVPNCHPKVTMSDREIWMAVGRRELVRELNLIQDQIENQDSED